MSKVLEHATRGDILLVDDTPNNLRLLSAMLIEQGYEVRRVVNGQMALKTAQANPPDLILLDIKMPDMNGYEVCQHLKAIAETQSIPVIFISALDEVLDKVKAFAVGGVDYITKPFSEEEVFARVENILTIRKLQQQLLEQNQTLQQEAIERQQLNERLFSSEARYDHLFNNPLIGTFQIRISDGLILAVNQRFADLFCDESVEAIAQRKHWINYFVNPNYWRQILAELQSVYDSGLESTGSTHSNVQFYRPDQSILEAHFSVWRTADADCLEGVIQHSVEVDGGATTV
jgi:CheY-like chemotaxis protein